ncbi:DUF937 domain-containing protein [Elizabethkingia argentiflava]|uniref:DUF937 domain-containing protein n=1 Tax=Elizabethkingia argenteiflava TaxID=2681556 RepID=A0A845PWP6_9FLAO|nr:DUF937 domain-containing protein [Elizabethkingia argenteiflava]NAW51286.1 DUF937 domain-containing protein [Elizabethkingia argenteiflava]
MSLLNLITGNPGNQIAEQAENKMGVTKSQMIALLAVAAPLIISYLRNKSKNTADAEALDKALDKDHDGSILNNPSQALDRQDEGNSILEHVFGNDKPNIENQLSKNTGISLDKIGPAMSMLAPVVMGYIGQQKQTNNTQANGLGDLLGNILGHANNEAQASPENPLSNVLKSVLGGEKSEQGGITGLLGSIFGK